LRTQVQDTTLPNTHIQTMNVATATESSGVTVPVAARL